MPKETYFNLNIEKQDRIIEAAREELKVSHYKKITIDKIVGRADIPKGSFYQYFINKDDLYTYIFKKYGEMKKESIELLEFNPKEIEIKDLLSKLIIHGQKFEEELDDDHMLKHKFMAECSQEVKKEIMEDVIQKGITLLVGVLNKYKENGDFREGANIEVASYMIVMSMISLEEYESGVKEWKMDLIESVKAIINTAVDGLIKHWGD